MKDLDIVECGAGTGGLTVFLAKIAKSVMAFDIIKNMLQFAEKKIKRLNLSNCSLQIADNRSLPIKDKSADVVIEAWSFLQMASWNFGTWRDTIQNTINEMKRVLKDFGNIILIETLGTAKELPSVPAPYADFYKYLEEVFGFKKTWVRTDYRFNSVKEAANLMTFFFGKEIGEEVKLRNSNIVPECTGIWWRSE